MTANVVLWPKVFVMSINRKRFDSLSPQQQEWIRGAAKDATQASVDAKYDESSIATELCGQGVRFVNAQPDQISALRTKIRPVIQRLAADPENAELRYELGKALAAARRYPEALEMLYSAAERDRPLARGKVKETMVQIFHAIGVRSDLADEYRDKLQRVMY